MLDSIGLPPEGSSNRSTALGSSPSNTDKLEVAAPETSWALRRSFSAVGERLSTFTKANIHNVIVLRQGILAYEQRMLNRHVLGVVRV